ncbi:MAG: HAD-IA family hydrolase [Clostridia bacterium]|nr:HAD-IA family hydrolase [Clostridia bacterium]
MIKNIVFDCSDTLLRFSAQDELAKVTGDNARAAEIKGKIHQSRSWNLYDKGIISEEELRQGILPLFDEADRPYAAWYLDNWLKCYSPIPGMFEIVAELREKGWPLYIVSDFPLCFDQLRARFSDLFQNFTGLAVSHECQATKGDKGLFAYFLQKFSIDPTECIFIDDVPRLVENARSMGFQGIVLENAKALRDQLEKLNIL